jgi:CDGSH-type Zn-finger protein
MAEIVIKAMKNGPYLVRGAVSVVDHEGRTYPVDERGVALCRCGQSGHKPFCDGTHKTCGFVAEETAG